MPLALVIFLIGLLIWRKVRAGTEWKLREQTYVFVLLTVGMLIKGPIVYAFLLPGIALFQWRAFKERHRKLSGSISDMTAGKPSFLETHRRSAWPGWWPWVASLAIFLIWVLGGIRFQPGFYQEVVMREFVGRFGETIHRPEPLFFYFPHLLHKFAPWSVLIIAIAIGDAVRAARKLDGFKPSSLLVRGWVRISPETFWLLCWSIGGLIVMSLIPSKRVDRIFPVIPPLCLLLAAQIAVRNSCSHGSVSRVSTSVDFDPTVHPPSPSYGEAGTRNAAESVLACPYQWSAIALLVAILFTSGYTIAKVVTGYRDHRDALVVFGRNVRHEAETRHWRYEVVSAKDEGLLLYLRKTHFIEPQRAVTEWNNESLDALVASRKKATILMPNLQGAVLSESEEAQAQDYVLITR
jgi:4-amino-4-deoxy-L-arabinose transferase-like glycosyltransferase